MVKNSYIFTFKKIIMTRLFVMTAAVTAALAVTGIAQAQPDEANSSGTTVGTDKPDQKAVAAEAFRFGNYILQHADKPSETPLARGLDQLKHDSMCSLEPRSVIAYLDAEAAKSCDVTVRNLSTSAKDPNANPLQGAIAKLSEGAALLAVPFPLEGQHTGKRYHHRHAAQHYRFQ